jgi:serine/threonine protein kinase
MGQQDKIPTDPSERCAGCGNVLSLCACRGTKNVNQNGSTRSLDFSSTVISGQAPAHLISPENLQNYAPSIVGMAPGNRVSVVGSIISERYELVAKLGSGGMGVVYKARHLALNKFFAIKIVSDHLANQDEFRLRFDREAKSASMLDHPNLVSVIDYGTTEFNEPYIVMDFINGRNLAEELAQHPQLSIERAVRIFLQICDGVGYAHEIGLVHRDLKPGNIMLTRAGELNEQVKIIDFGIAKLLPVQGDVTQSHTKTSAVGSPLYMSPEQCSGQKADRRSDIYSIGCLMYECLSSAPPFQGDSVLATISMHMNDAPEPFERFQIPIALEATVMRCLAKNPSERFQTMLELRGALAYCLTESSSTRSTRRRSGIPQNQRAGATADDAPGDLGFSNNRDPKRNSKPKRIWYQTPTAIVILSLLFVGIVALGAGMLVYFQSHPQNSASQQRESAEKSDAPREITPSNQSSTEKADSTTAQIPKLSKEEKQKLFQKQLALLGETPPIKDDDQHQTHHDLLETCKKLFENHHEKEALAYFKLAVLKNPNKVDSYDDVLDYFWKQTEKDKLALQKCINITTAYLIYHPDDYDYSWKRGQYYTTLADYPSAIADFKRALSSAVSDEQKTHIHLCLAFAHQNLHDLDAAIAEYEGNANVRDSNSLCLLANCYAEKRDFENAKRVATEALKTTSRDIQDPHQLKITLHWARNIRGGAFKSLGDYAKAEQDYRAALKLALTPKDKLNSNKDIEECRRSVGRRP